MQEGYFTQSSIGKARLDMIPKRQVVTQRSTSSQVHVRRKTGQNCTNWLGIQGPPKQEVEVGGREEGQGRAEQEEEIAKPGI